jgi:hypothetical protein
MPQGGSRKEWSFYSGECSFMSVPDVIRICDRICWQVQYKLYREGFGESGRSIFPVSLAQNRPSGPRLSGSVLEQDWSVRLRERTKVFSNLNSFRA